MILLGRNETSFDVFLLYDIDFGGQNATSYNNNTSAISTNAESTDTQTEHHDDTSEMYTNRMSEDTTRLHFGRSPNETRMQTSRYVLCSTFKKYITRLMISKNSCSFIIKNYFVILKG